MGVRVHDDHPMCCVKKPTKGKEVAAAYDSLLLRGSCVSKPICSLWFFVWPVTANVKHLSISVSENKLL